MERIPAAFQLVFDQWEQEGTKVADIQWTSPSCRHVQASIIKLGVRCGFAKLAIAQEPDQDESNMLEGIRREVWWSRVVEGLQKSGQPLPFTAPFLIDTNVLKDPFRDEVAWVIMAPLDEMVVPLLSMMPNEPIPEDISTETEFTKLLDEVTRCLISLEGIRKSTIEHFGLPSLPSPPHGMRRWAKRGKLDMETATLCNGAFELKNFYVLPTGKLAIIDNEFAGWYPPYDQLAYLYHRAYCNQMRPDVARRLLGHYMIRKVFSQRKGNKEQMMNRVFRAFTQSLFPHLLSGWFYDFKRRNVMPWHTKQRLRYRLGWNILCRNYGKL